MYLSELPGKHHGCREAAIDGHREIGRRCRELGVDTIVVLDVHWLVNAGYHVNCDPLFKGIYTSNELPHFIKNCPTSIAGNPALGQLIAETATERGVAHAPTMRPRWACEYGTLVPMRYMNADQHFKVVSVAAWCNWHALDDSRRFGAALKQAIEAQRLHGRCTGQWIAVAPIQRQRQSGGVDPRDQPRVLPAGRPRAWSSCGSRVTGRPSSPCCRSTRSCARARASMHDTAMLLGMLGWDRYDRPVEIITALFREFRHRPGQCRFPSPSGRGLGSG